MILTDKRKYWPPSTGRDLDFSLWSHVSWNQLLWCSFKPLLPLLCWRCAGRTAAQCHPTFWDGRRGFYAQPELLYLSHCWIHRNARYRPFLEGKSSVGKARHRYSMLLPAKEMLVLQSLDTWNQCSKAVHGLSACPSDSWSTFKVGGIENYYNKSTMQSTTRSM